jgi:hypothetical protein
MLVSPPNVWIKTSIQDHLYNQWILARHLSLSLSDPENDFEHFKQTFNTKGVSHPGG